MRQLSFKVHKRDNLLAAIFDFLSFHHSAYTEYKRNEV
jgi:hypothetical protein